MKNIIFLFILITTIFSCDEKIVKADAYGNFETDEWTISSELPGKLVYFDVKEGQEIKKGTLIGKIDSTGFTLKLDQLDAAINAIYAKKQSAHPEIAMLLKQKEVIERELRRVRALVQDEVGTQKQLDDIQGKIDVINSKIEAAKEKVNLANASIVAQVKPLKAQKLQIEDQIKRCNIYSPFSGTVLLKYVEEGEVIMPTQGLVKVANLNPLRLRAYIAGNQLSSVKLGQKVTVKVDNSSNGLTDYEGVVSWISSKAEFTPKIVQTKEERVNLVYAIKIDVKNDGSLKIGMPAEVEF